jgi:hypothetical protein
MNIELYRKIVGIIKWYKHEFAGKITELYFTFSVVSWDYDKSFSGYMLFIIAFYDRILEAS